MSLRLRMNLIYGGLLALTLAVFGVVLYVMMESNLEEEMDRRLRIRSQQILTTISPVETGHSIAETPQALLDSLSNLSTISLYVQFLDSSGVVIGSSSNLEGQHLVSDMEPLTGTAEIAVEDTNLSGTGTMRLSTMPIHDEKGATIGYLRVGQSKAGVERTLGALRFRLLIVGALALLIAELLGWLIAKNQLRPLGAISALASDLSKKRDFAQRLTVQPKSKEVRELVATINRLLDTVESTFSSHRMFLADTSHELRNPLLAIRTNLDLLSRSPHSEAQQECISEAVAQTQRMSRLVAELLLLARSEKSEIIDVQVVSLQSVLGEVTHEVSKRMPGHPLRVTMASDVEVIGDKERLQQIFANLIDNAVKHSGTSSPIDLSLRQDDSWAVVEVRDAGHGIAPEHVPHVFERFYRVETESKDGLGLGLAIVKHLCEAHGGAVTLQSHVGHGSCFTVRLPACSPSP
jgi:two-component system, OmpR family, sensor kinase